MTGLAIEIVVLGLLVTYAALAFKYVNPPYQWVIEENFPGKETVKKTWKSGIHCLLFPVKPFMFVRNKLYCADKKIIVTMGVDDQNRGDKSLVEFSDCSVGVKIQLILKVIDPIKATYEISDYEGAAVDQAEATFRKIFAGCRLDEAMVDLSKRNEIISEVFKDVDDAISGWGVILTNPGKQITILDFILSDDLTAERQRILNAEKAYQEQLKKAEADRETAKITAEGTVFTAEGNAKAKILLQAAEGKGESEKIKLLMDQLGLTKEGAIEYLLKLGMIDAVKGSTLIATSEGGNLNTPVGLAQTLFAVNDAQKKQSGKDNS